MSNCIDSFISLLRKPEIEGAVIGAIISVIGFLLISRNQNRIAKSNQFQSTFLSLLEILRQLVNNSKGTIYYRKGSSVPVIDVPDRNGEKDGPSFFTAAAAQLKANMMDSLAESLFLLAKLMR